MIVHKKEKKELVNDNSYDTGGRVVQVIAPLLLWKIGICPHHQLVVKKEELVVLVIN